MELETLQKRHREELERFQQHQLQLLIQQQQQASAFHQHHPLLYHTITGSVPIAYEYQVLGNISKIVLSLLY